MVGDPADEETDVGPVIDDGRAATGSSTGSSESGGEVLTGGDMTEDGLIRPTVIANPPPDAKVSCEEVFGPVCTVTPYDSLDEAIELANGTRYGLQAASSRPTSRPALAAARRLEFGGVTVNEAPTFRADQMPYGGVKDSGQHPRGARVRGPRADRGARRRPPALTTGARLDGPMALMSRFRRSPRPQPRRALPPPGVIRRERRDLQRTREEKLRDLGGLMLEMYRRDRFREDLLAERCNELLGLDARLHELDEMLAAARRRVPAGRCECGAPLPWGSHFCPNCGRPAGAAGRRLPECGHPLPADAHFCANCGAAARRAGAAEPEAPPEPSPSAEPAGDAGADDGAPDACPPAGRRPSPARSTASTAARASRPRAAERLRARLGAPLRPLPGRLGLRRRSSCCSSPPARRPPGSSPAATPRRRAARGRSSRPRRSCRPARSAGADRADDHAAAPAPTPAADTDAEAEPKPGSPPGRQERLHGRARVDPAPAAPASPRRRRRRRRRSRAASGASASSTPASSRASTPATTSSSPASTTTLDEAQTRRPRASRRSTRTRTHARSRAEATGRSARFRKRQHRPRLCNTAPERSRLRSDRRCRRTLNRRVTKLFRDLTGDGDTGYGRVERSDS